MTIFQNCSPGGSVTAGLGIYDTMQYVLPPIATWCVGQACSMASLLLASGSPGMRYSLPNARIMIHQPSGGARVRNNLLQYLTYKILIVNLCRVKRQTFRSRLRKSLNWKIKSTDSTSNTLDCSWREYVCLEINICAIVCL